MPLAALPNLASVNLNLLVSLEALLDEAHVGRAAQRLGVTQSAMSQSLKQLRELYDDALLTRGERGLVLTPRAQELARGLRRGLAELHRTFAPAELDLRVAVRTFVVAMSDWTAAAIVPPLMQIIAAEAPGITLRVAQFEADPRRRTEQLEDGALSAVIGSLLDPHPQLHRCELLEGSKVGVARAGHPTAHAGVTVEAYAAMTHVAYGAGDPAAPSLIDTQLANAGLERRVVLHTSSLLVAALAVAQSDHVLVVRRHVAATFARWFHLKSFELPPELLPTPTLELVWHERFDADPAERWLRGCVVRAAERAAAESA